MTFDTLNAAVCGMATLRLILFAHDGRVHRPWASLLAYLLVVAFGAMALLIIAGLYHGTSLPQLLVNAIFAAAIWAVRGNVVELFRHADPFASDCKLLGLLRKPTWF